MVNNLIFVIQSWLIGILHFVLLISVNIIGFILLIKTIDYYLKKYKLKKLKKHNQWIATYIKALPKLEPLDDIEGLKLNAGEVAILAGDAYSYTVQKPADKAGFFNNVHFPLPFGMSFNLGTFKVSRPQKEEFDSNGFGNYYLTNERFIFLSHTNNIILPIKSIIKVSNLEDKIKFDIINKKPVIFNTGDATLYYTYLKLTFKSDLDKMLEMFEMN